jgi:hypothetical protein
MKGRIYFPGNPWPEGHALKELTWSVRIEPARGLFFDLNLESTEYYAERRIDDDGDEEAGELRSDFEAPGVWGNYHACTLSSNRWHHGGCLAGSDEAPLSFAGLADRTFVVDDPSSPEFDEADLEARAFHIYLLGHDAVADHRIRFTLQGTTGMWNLDWTGRIALAYAGDYELRYTFRVEASELSFAGFQVADGMSDADAIAMIRRWCSDAGDLAPTTIGTTRYLRRAA